MRTNVKPTPIHTHEGAVAQHISSLAQLRRSVMSCLLWESEFYEDGESIADRIKMLVPACDPAKVAALAIEARTNGNLRHVPLLLIRELARHPRAHGAMVGKAIRDVIQRADEPAEFLSLYWKDGRQPLSKQVKKGLAAALRKFNAYSLAKYNRDGAIKLRDVLFLVHAKPKDEQQAADWKALVEGTLAAPDTWEVALSAGADKKATFERLIREGQLGYLALLRNLRNMTEAGCDEALVREAILARKGAERVLPFRYIAAARAAPRFERELDTALCASMVEAPRLPGHTVVMVDVSGSMDAPLSSKSDLQRVDAACGVAAVIAGIGERVSVYSFSNALAEVPPRQGMALIEAVNRSQPHSGTYLGQTIKTLHDKGPKYDRLIVVTDEQAADKVPAPNGKGYMINVASAKNGVGYGAWTHLDGFSESVVRFIRENETQQGA